MQAIVNQIDGLFFFFFGLWSWQKWEDSSLEKKFAYYQIPRKNYSCYCIIRNCFFVNVFKNLPRLPNHKLKLKLGLPIMLIQNLNQNASLCNGTRSVITKLGTWVIEAKIITGNNIGIHVFIPRITLSPSDSKWPFLWKRRHFPVSVCFAMTFNKSQRQSLKHVKAYL